MNFLEQVQATFTDVAADHKEDNKRFDDPKGAKGLHLKVIGTPQLLKSAHNMFTLARGENEDHSGYPQFLIDLDRLLIKNGGVAPDTDPDTDDDDDDSANRDQPIEKQPALEGSDDDDDDEWK